MTTLKPCHAGDVGDTRVLTLSGVADLNSVASIESHVTNGVDTTATLTTTVTDGDANEVTVALGESGGWLPLGPTLGQWRGQVEVVFNDGAELTWPNNGRGFFTINVLPQYG